MLMMMMMMQDEIRRMNEMNEMRFCQLTLASHGNAATRCSRVLIRNLIYSGRRVGFHQIFT